MIAWRLLAFAVASSSLAGCYLAHERLEADDGCDCVAGEICIEACWGERACVADPGPARWCSGGSRASCCFADDPCAREFDGFCGSISEHGIARCACISSP